MERNRHYNILHGAMQSLALNMFQPFLGIFAIRLGGSNTIVALLSALPALTSAATMIPGAFWLARLPRRKGPAAALFLASRLFLLTIALVPLFSRDVRAPLLAALVGLMNLPAAMAMVSWTALCGDAFSPDVRAEIFAERNRWMALCGLLPTIAVGLFLDRVSFPLGYQLIFLLALGVSLVEIWFLQRLIEPPTVRIAAGHRRSLAAIRRETGFWRYTLVSLCFYFPWQMGWPLFTIYQVNHLHANNLWMAIIAVTGALGVWVSSNWWGRKSTQKGNVRLLVLATGGLALSPVFFVLSDALWPVALFNLVMGFFSAGALLLFFNGLLETIPAEDAAAYVAYHNTLVNLSAFMAPLVGTALLGLVSIKGALLINAGARLAGSLAIALWLAAPARQAGQPAPDHTPPLGGEGRR